MAGSGLFVYFTYFMPKDDGTVYVPRQMEHITLQDEILKFTFHVMPDVYAALVDINKEITLINQEIARINTVGSRYPDQAKIADKERKRWETTRDKTVKSLEKIEKQVEALFVAVTVNQDQGMEQVLESMTGLTQSAGETLSPAAELTQRLKTQEVVPEGLINRTLYTLKKKYENFGK
ncbi:MAG: hypothetical protein V1793_00700 [Pseudomonadota bacterium]